GSSDAGAVLRACERLNPRPLGPGRLGAIAATLGSDVPFLAGESAAAIGTGRGEQLAPSPPLPVRDVALVFPPFGIPTKDAYRWLAESRGQYPPLEPVMDPDQAASWDAIATWAENDFEAVVVERHPEIGNILDALRSAGALLAMLSGSGSTVFGVFAADDSGAAPELLAAQGTMPAGARIVWTRTARRVVPVVASG
ncbi:MAG: hypothetical protein H0X64_10060, partial [Gemmatimonadaceae bacterium]|nr:hypothetical protein [Gemmatimonadaceae bacterium]